MQLQVGDDGYAALLAAEGHCHFIHLREREFFGFDHGVLAGHMLRTWNVPSPVPEAIGLHHHLGRAYDAGGMVADMVHLLRVAELLGDAATAERPDDEVLDALVNDGSVSFVELTRDDLVSLWSEVHTAIVNSKRQLAGGAEEQRAPGSDQSGVHVRHPTRVGIDPFGDDGPRLPRYKRSTVARNVGICVGIAAAITALVSLLH